MKKEAKKRMKVVIGTAMAIWAIYATRKGIFKKKPRELAIEGQAYDEPEHPSHHDKHHTKNRK